MQNRAYSARYIVGVWAGRPDGRPMTGMSGSHSASLARDILLDLHGTDGDGLVDINAAAPPGLQPVTLCAATGKPVTDSTTGCDRQLTEYMPVNAVFPDAMPKIQSSKPGLRIVTPLNNTRILLNPETPDAMNLLPLRLNQGTEGEVIWYVDGRPLQAASAGDDVRWPLQSGTHTFQARRMNGVGI